MPELAPPEPISVEPAAVKQAFAAAGPARFMDLSGRFTFDDRATLTKAVEDLSQKTGGKVWVLALPGKTDVNTYASIHSELKLKPQDVLFIFSQERRHLHSQALTKPVGNEILQSTNKQFYKSQTAGILDMLKEVEGRLAKSQTATGAPATTTTSAPAQGAPRSKTTAFELVLLPVAIAVVAWLLLKTRKPAAARPSRDGDSGDRERGPSRS